MPVSAELLKALADDPKSLEQHLGCMTGLFQIFDRPGLGRRYGSKRVSNAGSGQSQPTSACETPRQDHRGGNPYWMFEDDASQRTSGDAFVGGKQHVVGEHHHSDSSELFTKSFTTPTESRTPPDEKLPQLELSPRYSEDSVGGLPSYGADPVGSDHSNQKKLKVVVPARGNPCPSDIRDIVRASFDRSDPQHRIRNAELTKPRWSVDGGHGHHHPQGYVKNLPRSSSVDGRDNRLVRSSMDQVQTASHTPHKDLPRSSSVGGTRGAARILADWKDGLRSSSGSPRLTIGKESKQNSDLLPLHRNPTGDHHSRKIQNLGDGRDATRLTVELKEGPRLSVEGILNPRPSSSAALPHSFGHRLRDPHCELNLLSKDFNPSIRAADIKEFLRGAQKGEVLTREGHRFSVDGTRDAPRASSAPRLSVDGREYSTTHLVPRKLKLDHRVEGTTEAAPDQFMVRQSSSRGGGKAPNVVARLMGLEELPNSTNSEHAVVAKPIVTRKAKETNPLDEFFHLDAGSISPPPPPSPPDDYDYAHPRSSEVLQRHWQKRDADDPFLFTSAHRKLLSVQSSSSRGVTSSEGGDVMNDSVEDASKRSSEANQPQAVHRKVSSQGRRSLWHIFELKGLLNGSSSKKKQAEAVRLHNLKLATEEKESEESETKMRSQSLPPRLSSSSGSNDRIGLEYPNTQGPGVLTQVPSLNHESGNRYTRAASAEQHNRCPTSGHRQATVSVADEEPRTPVVKPFVIARSWSYKSPATAVAAPSAPTVSDNPDEDGVSKTINRGVSKGVAFHKDEISPLQAGADSASFNHNATSSSAASCFQGQSRKERGAAVARNVKKLTSSDVAQDFERDSTSPRGPLQSSTNTQQQEKPQPRSCSSRGDSQVSPRCPGSVDGMHNLMEAGAKVRRRQAVAVKDREETKASLANLRANATKQEFLKGRASGDPDTPRLLRRNSSAESKLLSKIAEKPIAADTVKQPPGGERGATPSMTLLRSKRPVTSVDNKSPLKSRPTRPLNAKSVTKISALSKEVVTAADHVNRPKAVSTSVPEPAPSVAAQAEQQPPAEAQATAPTEVQPTESGALDHSGDATHSNAKEQRTESETREKSIEMIDEGVKTPRGVSIKKIDFSGDPQAEVAEQPSPVSVLDNSHFEEELTPSPKASKPSVVCLQEQNGNEKDRRWSPARFLDLDLDDSTTYTTTLLKVPESMKEETGSGIPSVTTLGAVLEVPQVKDESAHRHSLCVCLKDADEERTYVEELVEALSLASGGNSPELMWATQCDYVMDPSVFDQLETKRGQSVDDDAANLDRRLLFDCVNEMLEKLPEAQVSWSTRKLLSPRFRKRRPVGQQLVKEILVELEDIPCAAASEDVCDCVYVILQKDLVKGRGDRQWSDYSTELEEVGGTVERMIVKDLIEETVRELSAGLGLSASPGAGGGASRRQLFA